MMNDKKRLSEVKANINRLIREVAETNPRAALEFLTAGGKEIVATKKFLTDGVRNRKEPQWFSNFQREAVIVVERTKWLAKLEELKGYKKENGHCLVPRDHTVNGVRLGLWVMTQRGAYNGNGLSDDRTAMLDAIGFVWDAREAKWLANLEELKRFEEVHGDCLVPRDHIVNGVKLGEWVSWQRTAYNGTGLSKERIAKLKEIGFVWDAREAKWLANLEELKGFKEENGDCLVPQGHIVNGVKLGKWVVAQRHKKSMLSGDRTAMLDAIGFVWDATKKRKRTTDDA
jgi:hypothetical protein